MADRARARPGSRDDDAVSGWLRRLSERPAGARPPTGPIETPAAPTVTGPLALTPLPADDDADSEPNAESYFAETLRTVRRAPEPKTEKARDLFRVLSKNIDGYLRFTRRRLAYLYQGLRPKDRATFSVIPWLLHTDQPGLPGAASGGTPVHGVHGYEVHKTVESAVAEVFPRIQVHGGAPCARPGIRAVLVMGSVGTIGHGGGSDIDYWVVYDADSLSASEQRALAQKVEQIGAWARERGLDAHFFLVDAARARRDDFGRASENAESSGTAMGRLLKEEFYRTAIYLAGDLPLWWTAPIGLGEEEYQRLAALLQSSGATLIPGVSFVDLGNVGVIDRGEFFGAALWQINKSLKSPFKSLLKMALLARYLNDDHPVLLCEILKKRVFEGERAPQFTDPYILLFDAISEYYARRGEWTSFRLIQKCFYLKVGLKLSRERRDRDAFLQRFRVMRAYIVRWGWDRELLTDLDSLENWSIDRVDALGQSIRSFMLQTYRQLVDSVRTSAARIDEEDVAVLGRRLYSCFAEEPGKVAHLFTYFLKEPRIEERLVALEVPNAPAGRRWECHRHLVRGPLESRGRPMHVSGDLGELGAWAVFNGLFASSTVVGLVGQRSRVSLPEFRHLLERFSGIFETPDPFAIAPSTFLENRHLSRIAVVANFDVPVEPEDASGEAGVHFLPESWDILNYGRGRVNRVVQVTLVTLNSWGEMFSRRYVGPEAVTQALRWLFLRFEPNSPLEVPPELFVPHGRQFQALRNRLGRVLEVLHHVGAQPLPPSVSRIFLYEVGGRFQVARQDARRRTILHTRGLRGALRLLGSSSSAHNEVVVDALSPALSDARAIVERGVTDKEALVLVAWRLERDVARIYVRDELAHLVCVEVPAGHLDRELSRVLRRTVMALRARVTSAAELRRVLRVLECRDGRGLGAATTLADDTLRALSTLGLLRARTVELKLSGSLDQGRDGIVLTLGNEVFSPAEFGRSCLHALVYRLRALHGTMDPDVLTIDASEVDFGDDALNRKSDRGLCRQLRLIGIYERCLKRLWSRWPQEGEGLPSVRSNGFRRAGPRPSAPPPHSPR